jgi:sporulation protein YlmC with PRC-barrel domain
MLPFLASAALAVAMAASGVLAQTALPPGAVPPDSAPAGERAPSRDVRLVTLFGQSLIDAQGRDLGRVDDAVLDLNNDRVAAFRVLQDGGRRDVALDAVRPRDRGLEIVPPNAPRAEPTPADIAAARQLLGTAVRDADGAALGRIEDIVVDMDGLAIRYAVLNVAPAGAGEGRLVPLPMRSFTRQEGGELRASLVRAKLDAAPGFTPTAWPRLGDPVWQARLRSWFATVPMRDATNVKSNQG